MKYVVEVNGRRITVECELDEVRVDGETVSARLESVDGTPVRLLRVGDRVHRLVVQGRRARGEYNLWLDGVSFDVTALDTATRMVRDLTARSAPKHAPTVVAPMPGLIVRIDVVVGDEVKPGQPLVVMEAMKMENELRATAGGHVACVLVSPGQAVDKGAPLVTFD
jgi:biotin carboxyl carrier protein